MTSKIALGVVCLAAVLAILAGRSQRGRDDRQAWFALAAAQALFAIELVARTRLIIGDPIRAIAVSDGLYQARRVPQAIAMLGIAALFVALGGWGLRSLWLRRYQGTVLTATAACLAMLFTFAVEAVSLHQVDAVLDRSLGPLRLYGLIWIGSGLVVAVSAARQWICQR